MTQYTKPIIPSFFAGRTVFITGGTGFMGKVLVERLLSTCPDVACLYLLMRGMKHLSPEDRLLQMKQSQLFDVLRASDPQQLDKIQVIHGDVILPDLGITANCRAKMKNVSIVIHNAATVKLQEELKQSVALNLRSVIELLKLCDTLHNIDAFIHVSTAYCNAELTTVEEKVYPPPMNLNDLLELVDKQELGAEEVQKVTSLKPNTYTFTKAMAEHAVEQHGCKRYPVAIFRPSTVVSSHRHPFPGWIENLNGPSGVIAAAGAGVLRVFTGDMSKKADLIPVDIVIDRLLAVAWETAVDRLDYVRVYNCTANNKNVTWGSFKNALNSTLPLYPTSNAVMYPHLICVKNRYIYKILVFFLQTIPLHIMYYISKIFGIKSLNLIKVNQKMKYMNTLLEYFTIREWDFKNDNVIKLTKRLSKEDHALFNLDVTSIKWDQFYTDFIKGVRKHVLKESGTQLNESRTVRSKI